MAKPKILVVDDESAVRFALRDYLEFHGFAVDEASACAEAEARYRKDVYDAVTLDYALPDGNALDLLPRLKAIDAGVPIVLITAQGSIELAVRSIQLGAEQFLVKPVDLAALQVVLERVLENQRNRRKQVATDTREKPLRALDLFLGESPAIRRLEEQATRAASAESPILIQGDTGTGKSELARWLHRHSSRGLEPLLELNCGGFTREFLDTELFGHEKGAFTGAVAAKVGLLEAANRGTVFLDELGDMDLQIQPKLLKALEEKRFRRLGEVHDRKVDFRLIGATHRNLEALVRERLFRADLFYRVSAIQITVPPLSERAEDIPELAQSLLGRITEEWGREPVKLSREALGVLQRHGWPGNIRELRNVLERALLGARTLLIESVDLDFASSPRAGGGAASSRLTLKEMERFHIIQVLKEEGGRVEPAARRLDIPRSTLYQKIKALGL
ncbi:sigma-54-dependent transcriptional regulator [Mesoterricola silvestris]|uniref:Two-component system response regulator n=1 Tax=Mesoterricola silvestris TaxID=2927979 RepID=A0AA48GX71_9BACT|nr:sigma-54 dependent transcriptional regulator [Mesoterricola silvestris]BDU71998.1 two-component system response regulator [Mesoterricola silvestris]